MSWYADSIASRRNSVSKSGLLSFLRCSSTHLGRYHCFKAIVYVLGISFVRVGPPGNLHEDVFRYSLDETVKRRIQRGENRSTHVVVIPVITV